MTNLKIRKFDGDLSDLINKAITIDNIDISTIMICLDKWSIIVRNYENTVIDQEEADILAEQKEKENSVKEIINNQYNEFINSDITEDNEEYDLEVNNTEVMIEKTLSEN